MPDEPDSIIKKAAELKRAPGAGEPQKIEAEPGIERREQESQAVEKAVEIKEAAQVTPPPATAVSETVAPRVPRDEIILAIEKILSEDLEQTYLSMPPRLQREFKKKGEETAAKIRELVRAAKIRAKKIVKLIVEWLKLIPRVNKFFLEQEAKIKTDRILAAAARKKEEGTL